MTKLRIVLVAILFAAPFAFMMGVGGYHLYATGWSYYAWWPMAVSMTVAYVLAWSWTRQSRGVLPKTGVAEPPGYWTDRDRDAWKIVEAKAATLTAPTADELADTRRYADEAIALALEIARIYAPSATDPFGHLTLPEILTCAELVSHDLAARVNKYVPGSHLMRVNDWKTARKWIDWGQQAYELSWLARVMYNPVKAGMQFLATKAGSTPLSKVQDNVLLWFRTAYLHELGRYLIELNSGRLRVGAARYRELMAAHEAPPVAAEPAPADNGAVREPLPRPQPIVVAVIGQVKAGKSSLVNALLGEHRAATDVVPLTAGNTRYELRVPGTADFVLLDTAGYGLDGPTDAEFTAALAAAESADLLLLVAHARTAARKPDVDMLDRLAAAFAARPRLRVPPVLLALTHVDLLSPATEWAPPYDWHAGERPKERQMREAVEYSREQFGLRVAAAVPVCTAAGKEFGMTDDLLPELADRLDDARGAALLRTFNAEAEAARRRRVVNQVLNAGREALRILWANAGK
jgi:predicted GTPase